jgi:4-hydroxysphinganine ceramide fatty acyl 2-hydroxylase
MSPSRTLPTFLQAEVAAHNTAKSCYVTLGNRVFDVTDFIDSHPGGGELVLEYGGKDITTILKDEASHTHSEAAYEVLDDSLVGFMATPKAVGTEAKGTLTDQTVHLPPTQEGLNELKENGAANKVPLYATTGLSSAEDLSKETDLIDDYKTYKFLDLNKPLLMQVWFGGFSKDFYLEQVHRPRHYKGGESAPLFGNFLEPLSKTPWWVIPLVWLPPVSYGTYIARAGCSSLGEEVAYWFLGLFLWTLVEYLLHRFLFHLDRQVEKFSISLDFIDHMQLPSQQPCCHYTSLPSSWHSSLLANGQVKAGYAANPFPRPRYPILETGTLCVLLELVGCHSSVLWRHIWLHLLRLDALLPSPPNLAVILEGIEEISSSTSLYGLRKWFWCNVQILGRYLRHTTCATSYQDPVETLAHNNPRDRFRR